jgi:hypothetical protein
MSGRKRLPWRLRRGSRRKEREKNEGKRENEEKRVGGVRS